MNRFRLFVLLAILGSAIVGSSGCAVEESKRTGLAEPRASSTISATAVGCVLVVQCAFIVASSLVGGWLPQLIQLNHTRMQLLISFVGGLMLGIGLFHLLPHSVAQMGSIDEAVWWMVLGTITTFFLLRTFQFHHHEPSTVADVGSLTSELLNKPCANLPEEKLGRDEPAHALAHRLSWTGVALGLSLHTLIDGMALAASVQGDAQQGLAVWGLGLGTFLAILLHKPLDALSITSLMAVADWRWRSRQLVNVGFALMCPLGAAAFVLGVQQFAGIQHILVGCALAFSAGVFLCISMSDLLPELEFHAHDRFKLSVALLTGVSLAYAIGFLEPAHIHEPPETTRNVRSLDPGSARGVMAQPF